MSIRAKISFLAAAILALLVLVGGVAVDGLWRVQEELKSLYRDILPLDAMIESLAQQELKREAELYAAIKQVAEGKETVPDALVPLLREEAGGVAKLMASVGDHADEVDNPEIAARLREPRENLISSGSAFAAAALELAEALKGDDRTRVNANFDLFFDMGRDLRSHLDELKAAMLTAVEEAASRTEELEAQVRNIVIIGALAALAIGVLGSILISGMITRPIEELVRAARKIEGGSLDVEVPVRGSDEMAGLGRTFNHMVEGLRTKERIKETFGKYIEPRIVSELIAETRLLASNRRTMTVSLTQYVGFHEFAENKVPAEIVDRINLYYDAIAMAVSERNGVVDKMMGDIVLTFFGPPFTPSQTQAEMACLAALEQIKWRPKGEPDHHRPRVAIASEASIVGTMGSDQNRSFTIMGDSVALADVMLTACAAYGADILITGATRASVGDVVVTRHLDTALLPGQDTPVELHAVLGKADDVAEEDVRFARAYEAAFDAYAARDFERARDLFETCARKRPGDAATEILLQRLDIIEMDPPGEDWGGTWRLIGS